MKNHYTMPLILLLMAFLISPLRSFPAGDDGEKQNIPKIVRTKVTDNFIPPNASLTKDVKIKTHDYGLKGSRIYNNNLQLSTSYSHDTIVRESEQSREVWEGYEGWADNPDSLDVYIDTTWTEAEKDSCRAAMDRWNAAGGVPKFRETSSADNADITITQGDPGAGNAGLWEGEPPTGKLTSSTITIAENPSPGLVETVTHELGHAIGLNDTDEAANAGDVMKGSGPSNGTNGNLSQHDSTEMRLASASITEIAEDPPEHKNASSPDKAVIPGEFTDLNFDLPVYYPPESTVLSVQPIEDQLLFVEYAYIDGDQLFVGMFSDPMHGSGKIYFDIVLIPAEGDPYEFWGIHYINTNPVLPIYFSCPFEVTQSDGRVNVSWQDFHDYPYTNPLRSELVVDGNTIYKVKPNADYTIQLLPGTHTLELTVDDFQVNSASYAMDIVVEATTPPWEEPFEDYALGSDIVGQGGWEYWFGGESSPSARVTNEQVYTGEQALEIMGMEDFTGDDIVHQFDGCTSGVWEISALQFIPEDAAGGTTYFVLLNQYGYTIEECNWSTQIKIDPDLNIIESEGEGATLPLVKGQWAEISVVIDLDNDLQTISYNGQVLSTKSWADGVSGGGIPNIAAIDLWSNTLANAKVYYDDFSIQPYNPVTKYWLPFDSSPEGTPPDVEAVFGDENMTNVHVHLHGMWVTETYEDGELFHQLEIPGYSTTQESGKAAVPTLSELIGIISGAENVELGYGEVLSSIDFSGFNVYPYQTPLNEDSTGTFEYDQDFYATDMFYPETMGSTGEINSWGEIGVASITMQPVSVNPLLQHMTVNSEMEFQFLHEGIGKDKQNILITPVWLTAYTTTLVNATSLLPHFTLVTTLKGRYLIITADNYYNNILQLATWKKRKGYEVTTIKASTIGNPLTAASVKNTISTFYNSSSGYTVYVLLVGDVGSNPMSQIPIYTGYPGLFGYNMASDYYYSCMGGASDVYADLFLGRLSVDDTTEVTDMVNTIINYEQNPPTDDWVKKVLLAAHKENYPQKYTACKESIRTFAYTVTTPTFDTQYGGLTGTNAGVTNAINNGRIIVNYRGHGGSTSWSSWDASSQSYTTTNVNGLNPGNRTPLVYSISCWNNRIDYGSGDCIGEVWMIKKKSVSHFGATRPSPTTRNHALDKYLFKATYDKAIYHQGAVNNWAKTQMITQYGTSDIYAVGNARMYLLLGEPEMEIWTNNPATLFVTHAATITAGNQTFPVSVADAAGSPVSGALVCLWKGSEVFVNAYTNALGVATFTITPSTTGTMYVTATKHNYKPYLGNVSVTATPPDIWVKDCLADNGTTPSNGNCPAWWTSHDIWIDNNMDGIQDAPVVGAANKLYVRPRNMGPGTATSVTVDMYYRNNTTGLNYPGGAPYIGSLSGLTIPSGGNTSGWVTWTVPSPPTTGGHYCIGAVLSATYDPQSNTSPVWDNNVCCVNIGHLYARAGTPAKDEVEPAIADFLVRNPFDESQMFILDAEKDLPANWTVQFFDDSRQPIDLPYYVFLLPEEEHWINMVITPDPNAPHGEEALVVAKQYEDENYPEPEAIIGGINFPVIIDLYPPSAITDLEVSLEDDMMLLEWTPVTFDVMGNDEKMACYNIYRSTDPNFQPGPADRVGRVAIDQDTVAPGFQWYDETLKTTYYYLVRAEDEAGYESGDSNLGFIPVSDMDYGDAPDPSYPTLLASDGARHIDDGVTYLGNLIDIEPNGQPTPGADGDDLNNQPDEDGVVFREPLVQGGVATIKVLASVDGILNTWIDFNQNGSWADAGDHIFVDQNLVAGWNTLLINVPAAAKVGKTYIRFRFDSQGGLNDYGLAQNGEVEDYRVNVLPQQWGYVYTPITHTILVPLNVQLLGSTLATNDVIGVFYDDLGGNEICGGAEIWDGINNQVVLAYADDNTTPLTKEGFTAGETLTWKIHHTASGVDQYVLVTYDPAMPQSDGKYTNYGLSGLTHINGLTVTATAVPSFICAGDVVQLDANVTGGSGGETYLWTSNPPGFTSIIINPTDTPAVNTTYTVNVTDGGVTVSSSVDVVVQPGPISNSGPDVTICETNDITLAGSAANYSSVLWSTSGDGSFDDATSLGATYTPGPGDIAGGSAMLTLTAYPISPCTAFDSDAMVLAIVKEPTANAGANASLCPGDSYTLAGNATHYSSVLWGTSGDGAFDNTALLGATYTPGPADIMVGSVTLCLEAFPLSPCLFSDTDCMTLFIFEEQTVHLFDGWNGFSSYLTPYNSNDNNALFNTIISNLIVAYNFHGAFWPGSTNTLTWVDTSGYIAKMTLDDDLVFCGNEITNKVINLNQGWNIVPELNKGTVKVVDVFNNLAEVKIVMEVAGWKMYWPAYNINSLISLDPGKSYFACMNTAATVDFDVPPLKTGSLNEPMLGNNSPWNDVAFTPGNHVVAFTTKACANFETGDVIGGFTASGLCAGMLNFVDVSAGLSLNADEVYTNKIDGFQSNEIISYKMYRPSSGEMFDLEVYYDASLDNSGTFNSYGMSAVTGLKMSPTGIAGPESVGIIIYPNPSHGTFSIEGIYGKTEISIFNTFGEEVLCREMTSPGQVDLSAQSKGIYFIRITSDKGRYFGKLVVN